VVAILGVDEFIGEGCLIGQTKRLATASALSGCVTMRVGKAEIQRVLRDEPAFSQMFMTHILERSARVEEDVPSRSLPKSARRRWLRWSAPPAPG
jgi:CRP/FNR family cyclic AMP-dependent transcriptional regulator